MVYKFRCKISMQGLKFDDQRCEGLKFGFDILASELIFLHDIDFTVDLAGVFSRESLEAFIDKEKLQRLKFDNDWCV